MVVSWLAWRAFGAEETLICGVGPKAKVEASLTLDMNGELYCGSA